MKIREYQIGGEMAAPQVQEPQPSPEQQDPIMILAQAAQQALQEGSCELSMQVCSMFLELIAQASGQAGAPVGPAGPDETVVFKKGGSIVRRVKNGCKKVKK